MIIPNLHARGMKSGWVIERADSPTYKPMYWTAGGWSEDSLEAVRFARQLDADKVAATLYVATRVAEHGWG